MSALRFSPIGVSVFAWVKDTDGLYYKPKGQRDNHFVTLYGYKEGEYWKIFDHYDDTIKRLKWDYDFGFAKRYYIKKRPEIKEGWFIKWIKIIINFFKNL